MLLRLDRPRVGAWAPKARARSRSAPPVPATVWICDVNGLLIDSSAVVREAFAATSARYGFPLVDRDIDAVKGLWLLEAYERLDPGSDPWTRRAFHLAYVRERVDQLRAFPGVRETIIAAKQAGVRVGAATSHGEIAEACLVKTGLYAFIDCLVTQEDVKRPKPHPDSILQVLALLTGDRDAARAEALHVGDTIEDIRAGKAAGVRTIGATYGMSREDEIRSAGPDHVIHAFGEMRSWLPSAHAVDAAAACSCP